jgi:hypothetical protein
MVNDLFSLSMKRLYKIDPKWVINQNLEFVKSNRDLEVYLNLSSPTTKKNWGLIDRTMTFQMPLNFEIRVPLTEISPRTQTYDDACNSRAIEIINLAEQLDLKIYVMWSGGVDSTTVLSSLLANSSIDQQKRFIILLSQPSIKENLNYFKNFILGKLTYESSVNFVDLLTSGDIIVHGECQDQLYMIQGGRYYTEEEVDIPVTPESIKELILDNSYFDQSMIDDYIHLMKESAGSVGIELEKAWEYIWWNSFCFGIQSNDIRTFQFVESDVLSPKLLSQNIITFFHTSKFDQWAMQRVQNNKDMPSINASYKKESREYIFAFDKNKEYFDKKKKVDSGGILHSGFKLDRYSKKYIMDDSFNSVPIDKLQEYYNPNNYFSKYR